MAATNEDLERTDSYAFDVYFDESGNTGLHWFDSQQPVFVVAGWMVPRKVEQQAVQLVEDADSALPGQRSELKGSQLLSKSRHDPITVALLESLLSLGCLPTFLITEKRYAAAAKMSEAFLDPAYNSLLDMELTADTDRLQDYAGRLYRLSDSTLQQSWTAIRTAKLEPLRASLETAIAELNMLGDGTLAGLLSGSMPSIAEIADAYSTVYEGSSGIQGLPVPSLVGLLGDIDAWGEAFGQSDTRIFHDETAQFGLVIEQYFHHISNGRRGDIALPNGNIMRTGYASLKHFQFVESGCTPLIQAADVLAALLSTIHKTDNFVATGRSTLISLAANLMMPKFLTERYPADIMGSDHFIKRFTAILGQHIRSQTSRESVR